jgi:hypothetical protein
MCLSTVSQTFTRPASTKIFTAYKVFAKYNRYGFYSTTSKELQFPMQSNGEVVTRDKWMAARRQSHTRKPGRDRRYVLGFHAFVHRKDAIAAARTHFGSGNTVKKVFVAGVHTRGKQYNKQCFVANKMYVPLKTERPPKVTSAKTSAKRRASGKR